MMRRFCCSQVSLSATVTRFISAISSASSPPDTRSSKRALFQSKRLDCWLVNCSGNRQALVTLVIGQSRSRLDVQRTRYWLAVITCLLQGHLNIRDRLIGQQITVSVNGAVVIVVARERIVTPRRIPIASVQKEISAAHKNDGGEMLPPPVAVVPLLPMAAQRIGEATMIVFALRIGLHLALWRLMRRQIAARWLRGSDAGLRVRCCWVAPWRFASR